MGNGCDFKVRVVPNAKREGFGGLMDDGETLKVRISAPAVEGKANVALMNYLAGVLGLRPQAIGILRGEKSRSKVIHIEGWNRKAVIAKLRSR